jgi:hypothetical protein
MCKIICSTPQCKNDIYIQTKTYTVCHQVSMMASKGWYLIKEKWYCPNCFEDITNKEEPN